MGVEHDAKHLVQLLQQQGKKIATAESCTGGLVSEKITAVSGASQVFECGICSYSNRIKSLLLHVTSVEEWGAVSEKTAIQMAKGVLSLSEADVALSTTGIAGPTGGTTPNPVGTVYVGIATKEIEYAIRFHFPFSQREEIREAAANAALAEMCKLLLQ